MAQSRIDHIDELTSESLGRDYHIKLLNEVNDHLAYAKVIESLTTPE